MKMPRLARIGLPLVGLALSALACNVPGLGQGQEAPQEAAQPPAPESSATVTPAGAPAETPLAACNPASPDYVALPALLEQGAVSVTRVDSSGMGILGRGILQVEVTNETEAEVCVLVPPGFVFEPPDDGEQRMMVIQGETAIIPPGGTASLNPYLSCIDATRGAPEEGSLYTAGAMTENEQLRQLAECLAGQDLPDIDLSDPSQFITLDFESYLGLQLAVWSVSEEGGLDLSGGENAALSEEDLALMEQFMSGAQVWLDACGIEVSN